jgi:putative endonuclease
LAAQARGRFGENEALRWYLQRGYALVDRNWRCAAGEVDLILSMAGGTHATLVVFCEVKARASSEFGGPWAAVNWAKQRRLRRCAALWLAGDGARGVSRNGPIDARFDVAAVIGARVEVIEAAF